MLIESVTIFYRQSKSDSIQSNRRRSSRFLEGAAVPNSIIQERPDSLEPEPKDSTTRRKERDDFVAKVDFHRTQWFLNKILMF